MTREDAIKVLNMVEAHGLADEAKRMAIKALSAEPCGDCISREAALDAASQECFELRGVYGRIEERIKGLPPVQPIRPRGHWIESEGGIACSECGNEENSESYYCPWCGADMREE